MRWNGTDITGVPTFIYHDELLLISKDSMITNPDENGSLICTITRWFVTGGKPVTTGFNGNFIQREVAGPPTLFQVALNSLHPITTPRTNATTNGLWFCRTSVTRLYVGLYGRAQGED